MKNRSSDLLWNYLKVMGGGTSWSENSFTSSLMSIMLFKSFFSSLL